MLGMILGMEDKLLEGAALTATKMKKTLMGKRKSRPIKR